jgi:hypothetical protein
VSVTEILVLWSGGSVEVMCVVIALVLNWTTVENAKRVVAPVRPLNRVTPFLPPPHQRWLTQRERLNGAST